MISEILGVSYIVLVVRVLNVIGPNTLIILKGPNHFGANFAL